MELRTARQLVAANLVAARALQGWTQAEAAEAVQRWGLNWSRAVLSQAEATVRTTGDQGGRSFTAGELLALSGAFGVPLTWWFVPPTENADDVLSPEGVGPSDADQRHEADSLMRALFSIPEPLRERLSDPAVVAEVEGLVFAATSGLEVEGMSLDEFRQVLEELADRTQEVAQMLEAVREGALRRHVRDALSQGRQE